jgi:hypothetical protein
VGTGLNINYPVVEDGSTPRPELTETGRGFMDLTYTGPLPTTDGGTASLTVGVDLAVLSRRPASTARLSRPTGSPSL